MNRKKWLEEFLAASASSADIAAFDGGQPLSLLVSACDGISWVLIVLSIETELKVDIPDEVADATDVSVNEFIARVLALPKVNNPFWTFDRLSRLASALVGEE